MKRVLAAGAAIAAIAAATLIGPGVARERRIARLCASVPLGIDRAEAERLFADAGVRQVSSAGRPGQPFEIITWGERDFSAFSRSAFCSLQFDGAGRVSGVERQTLRWYRWLRRQSSETVAVKGHVDHSQIEWRKH